MSDTKYARQAIRENPESFIHPCFVQCEIDGEDCWTWDIYKADCHHCNRPIIKALKDLAGRRRE